MASEYPFTIDYHSGFNEDGIWYIDVRLTFNDGPPPLGSPLLGAGRVALLQAIAREAERGRALGANKVQVHMEGHDAGVLDDTDPGGIKH